MQIQDLSHPKNSKALNESVAKQFGYKLNIDKFSVDQLRAARDTLASQIAAFETSKAYDAVYESKEYQKNRMMLDVITQAISERALSQDEENKREKYVKGMKKVKGDFKKRYGDKGEEVMYATATKMAKKESVDEAMEVLRSALNETVLTEGEEEKAALIMSSRDMVDKLTGWLEDVASLKAEALLELQDSIRDELGNDVAQRFTDIVKPALEDVYNSLESNRQQLAQAVAILTGEEAPGGMAAGPAPMGAADLGAPESDLEAEIAAGPDEFGGTEAETGGEEVTGRMKRESVEYSRKLGTMLSSKKN